MYCAATATPRKVEPVVAVGDQQVARLTLPIVLMHRHQAVPGIVAVVTALARVIRGGAAPGARGGEGESGVSVGWVPRRKVAKGRTGMSRLSVAHAAPSSPLAPGKRPRNARPGNRRATARAVRGDARCGDTPRDCPAAVAGEAKTSHAATVSSQGSTSIPTPPRNSNRMSEVFGFSPRRGWKRDPGGDRGRGLAGGIASGRVRWRVGAGSELRWSAGAVWPRSGQLRAYEVELDRAVFGRFAAGEQGGATIGAEAKIEYRGDG